MTLAEQMKSDGLAALEALGLPLNAEQRELIVTHVLGVALDVEAQGWPRDLKLRLQAAETAGE